MEEVAASMTLAVRCSALDFLRVQPKDSEDIGKSGPSGRLHLAIALISKTGRLNVGKLGVGILQVCITLRLNEALVRSLSGGCPLTVSGIKFINDIHSLDNLTKRREALFVQESIPFLASVEKDLCGATVGPGGGKDNSSTCIRYLHRIVGNALRSPLALDFGVSIDSKLSNKAWKNSENSGIIVKLLLRQFLKSLDSSWSPFRVELNLDLSGLSFLPFEICHLKFNNTTRRGGRRRCLLGSSDILSRCSRKCHCSDNCAA
mmetsp:Transcript_124625/g.360529  ORF Transcript_124625/g.360529 Transcript_124625/m.360529 type:complete len:261 (-) Transcript_124625:401-1183(-)